MASDVVASVQGEGQHLNEFNSGCTYVRYEHLYTSRRLFGALMRKTAFKTQELRRTLEELKRLGSPVDLSIATKPVEEEKVEILQVGGIHDSLVFELPDGRIACLADISITNQSSRPIFGIDVQLRTSWCDSRWDWLQPRAINIPRHSKRGSSYLIYQFPGEDGLQWEYDQVINHFLFERRSLPSRRPLEGLLLGIGGLMPADLRHGKWLKLTLSIIECDHTEHSTTIELWTDRLDDRPKMAKPRSSLVAPAAKEQPAQPRYVHPSVASQ